VGYEHCVMFLLLTALAIAADRQEPVYPPWVLSGLRVEPAGGMRIRVTAGEAEIMRSRIGFPETLLELTPSPTITVTDEKLVLADEKPQSWFAGTSLRECTCFPGGGGTPLPYCLAPHSVRVKKAPGDGPAYEEGRDFLVDHDWGKLGRIPGGAIGEGQEVFVDYAYRLARLDSIALSQDGRVLLVRGPARKTCPPPPELDDGTVRLANVLVWYGTTEIKPGLIFPCGPDYPEPSEEERAERQKAVAHTLEKLRAGGDVVVCSWGDSVTAGGDAIPTEMAFPWAFARALREKYPQARVKLINAGIGGSSTPGRLPHLDTEVLSHKPDLVTIEFVNDCGLPAETVLSNWRQAVARIKAAGADVILITPHLVMPPWMGWTYEDMWGRDNRAAVELMRQVARETNVGLADVARRWEHLCQEGLPYVTLLWNGINHPDNRGHELFVRELMTFF